MSLLIEQRLSDVPFIESIMVGQTLAADHVIRPAEKHWHMVFVKQPGVVWPLLVGPLTRAGQVGWEAGAEILWIKFRLGTFMPHLPFKNWLDSETRLPEASGRNFWLKGSAWQFPTYENADTFAQRLVREAILVHDPLVEAALQNQLPDMSARTLRHRFRQATGLPQSHIYQMERARQAASLLAQGVSILDTVHEAGYFDQPHLTRSLKQFIGYTPAQLLRLHQPI